MNIQSHDSPSSHDIKKTTTTFTMETTTYPAGYDPNQVTHTPAVTTNQPHPTTSPSSSVDPNQAHHLDHPVSYQYVKGQDGEMYNQQTGEPMPHTPTLLNPQANSQATANANANA